MPNFFLNMLLKKYKSAQVIVLFIAIAMIMSLAHVAIYSIKAFTTIAQTETNQEFAQAECIRHTPKEVQKQKPALHPSVIQVYPALRAKKDFKKEAATPVLPVRGDILYLHMLKLF